LASVPRHRSIDHLRFDLYLNDMRLAPEDIGFMSIAPEIGQRDSENAPILARDPVLED
jgi:hypothetical protein